MNKNRTENIVDGEVTLAKLDTTGATAGQTIVMGASAPAWGTAGTATTAESLDTGIGALSFDNTRDTWTFTGDVESIVTADKFIGDGSGLTGLTAESLASGSGTLSFTNDIWTFTGDIQSEVRADYFSGDGSLITGIADSALSANVPLKNGDNTFTGNNSFTGGLTFTGLAIASGKTLTVSKTITLTSSDDTSVITLPSGIKTLLATDGSAASLTAIPAAQVTGAAALPDAVLSSNVPLKNGASNAFTGYLTAATTTGTTTTSAVVGVAGTSGTGVYGESKSGIGVNGIVTDGTAVSGTGTISATPIADLSDYTGTNTAWADGDNTKLWWAQKFTAEATATATAVSLKLAKGSATAPTLATSTITAYLFSDSTGAVGTVLAGGTGTSIPFSALTNRVDTDGYVEFYFGGMSAALTSGTAYWIVVKASAYETSAGSIVHNSGAETAGTYGTYNTGTSTWDYTAELAAWCKVHGAGGVGLSGTSTINNGVTGASTVGYGVSGTSTRSRGVYGLGQTYGVYGETQTSVVGSNYGIYGMAANSSGYGVGGTGSYGGGQFTGVTRGIDVVQTTGRSVITQTAASSTNEALLITRTSASNGTGPILLLNNAGSAVSGNLITAQTGGVDKFSVGVDGTIASASPSATLNGSPVSVWRGASSAEPSTDLVDGQLYFDTDVNTLYVYYSSAWHPCFVAP